MAREPIAANENWFLDDAFWRDTYGHMFGPKRLEAAAEEVQQILALAGVTAGDALDLACGPARHSVALARQGFRVTGVDRTKFLLAKARERIAEHRVEVELVEADMREFRRPNAFDLALCVFTSFGFFPEDADNQRVLTNVVDSLRKGGVLVMDMMGKENLARVFNPTSSTETAVGVVYHRRKVVDNWNRMDNEWTVINDGRVTSHRFSHWIYSGRELAQMLTRAGFSAVSLFGNYAGDAYGPDATRLVAVARK